MNTLSLQVYGFTDKQDVESATIIVNLEVALTILDSNMETIYDRIFCDDKDLRSRLFNLSPSLDIFKDFLKAHEDKIFYEIYPAELLSYLMSEDKGKLTIQFIPQDN